MTDHETHARAASTASKTLPPDRGLTLALTLARDRLAHVDRTLLRARNQFDHDEDAFGSFSLAHDPWCPALRQVTRTDTCACGLDRATEDLKDACRDMEQAREALDRCIAALAATEVTR